MSSSRLVTIPVLWLILLMLWGCNTDGINRNQNANTRSAEPDITPPSSYKIDGLHAYPLNIFLYREGFGDAADKKAAFEVKISVDDQVLMHAVVVAGVYAGPEYQLELPSGEHRVRVEIPAMADQTCTVMLGSAPDNHFVAARLYSNNKLGLETSDRQIPVF